MRRALGLAAAFAAVLMTTVVTGCGGDSNRDESRRVPPSGVQPRLATLENGLDEFDQTDALNGTLRPSSSTAYDGHGSARASYSGGPANGFARAIFEVSWPDGAEVWYGLAVYLPRGFYERLNGYVDLVRWDNWPSLRGDADSGGVAIFGSDEHARLVRGRYSSRSQDLLSGPFDLPEGRWSWLEVHQRLGDEDASNQVWINGVLVENSSRPNAFGRRIERVRYGLVSTAPSTQARRLDLWFDRASVSPTRRGPLSASRASG